MNGSRLIDIVFYHLQFTFSNALTQIWLSLIEISKGGVLLLNFSPAHRAAAGGGALTDHTLHTNHTNMAPVSANPNAYSTAVLELDETV